MLDHIRQSVERAGLTAEVRCWAGLGIAALAIAGVFAFLLAFSRIPGIETVVSWPSGFFEKGLVIHVVMSFVVWFLAIFATLVTILGAAMSTSPDTPGIRKPLLAALPDTVGSAALPLAAAGFVLLVVPALLDRGQASLNNYIPVIMDPLYIAGLLSFALGLVLVSIRYLIHYALGRGHSTVLPSLSFAGLTCCLILFLALSCVGLAWLPNAGAPHSERLYEDLFWGGGHVLQYLNTALMLAGWYLLGALATGREPMPEPAFRLAMLLCLLPAMGGPLLYWIYGVNSGALTITFTNMQYLMAPPVVLAGVMMVRLLVRHRRHTAQQDPGQGLSLDLGLVCIALSLATFAIGGTLGLFVDGTDTRTPAHYHAVIAAINLVFMGLFFQFFLPVMGRSLKPGRAGNPEKPGRAVFILVWLYATGQMIASLGLFLAGGYGAPRKTAGPAQGLEDIGAMVGLYMNGIGAVIAVAGGIMFIWLSARALLRRWQ